MPTTSNDLLRPRIETDAHSLVTRMSTARKFLEKIPLVQGVTAYSVPAPLTILLACDGGRAKNVARRTFAPRLAGTLIHAKAAQKRYSSGPKAYCFEVLRSEERRVGKE